MVWPYRYNVLILTAASAAFMFAQRNVINVAILAMTESDRRNETSSNSLTIANGTIETVTTSPISGIQDKAPTYDWTQAQQGVAIGAYFYTYTAVQIQTGWLADKFDVVHLTVLSQLLGATVGAVLPLVASNLHLFVALRMIQGLAHAVIFPCCYNILERWFTPQEKAFAIAAITMAWNVGIGLTMPVTAWLCENGYAGGWPSAFYSISLTNMVFVLVFYIMVTSHPKDNCLMGDKEKLFIESHVVHTPNRKTVPWMSILTSIPLWATNISRGCCALVFGVVNSRIPFYMETILGYSLQKNGLINSSFYVAGTFGQMISGPVTKYYALRGNDLTLIRKGSEAIAALCPAFLLFTIPYLSDPTIIVIGLVVTMFALGFTTGGDIAIVPDMAPGIVGTVFGFANILSCCSGFIAPMAIAYIIEDQVYSAAKWNLVFYVFGGVGVTSFIVFSLFASAKPQPWALEPSQGETEMNNRSIQPNKEEHEM